jgi:hypothetical protein
MAKPNARCIISILNLKSKGGAPLVAIRSRLVARRSVRSGADFTRWKPLAAKTERFVGRHQAALGKLGYFGLAALLFLVAAWNRFSLPQDPLADPDAYLWPAISKLSGGSFPHLQGLNFLYPGIIYLILRIGGDFRAITVIQHLLGLAAGALFLASWSRLAEFCRRSLLSRTTHQAIGLFGAGIYLLSTVPVWFEMRIRSDSVCMFFQVLVFWLVIQFFYYRLISPNIRKAVIYAIGAGVSGFLLASLKPSFTLMALFAVAPVFWLTATIGRNITTKLIFFAAVVSVVFSLTFTEHYLRRNDPGVKIFLPQTLFAIHAKIIHGQMVADLEKGQTGGHSAEWLRKASDDLGKEIQRTHDLYPQAFPVLGFQPDYLHYGRDSLLHRWRRELGDERFSKLMSYWYWHSLVRRPLAFVAKIVAQMRIFYSTDCPGFSARNKWPLSAWSYTRSLSVLSQSQWWKLLVKTPAGAAFVRRTEMLCSRNIVIRQNKAIQLLHVCCARTYLLVLLISVPLAGWFLLKQNDSYATNWPALWVLFFYFATFGNVLGVSVVHSMEVARYSNVLLISALFAQIWAIRWLIDVGSANLRKLSRDAGRLSVKL